MLGGLGATTTRVPSAVPFVRVGTNASLRRCCSSFVKEDAEKVAGVAREGLPKADFNNIEDATAEPMHVAYNVIV